MKNPGTQEHYFFPYKLIQIYIIVKWLWSPKDDSVLAIKRDILK